MLEPDMQCPLCDSTKCEHYFRDIRDYFECGRCQLVFVPPDQRLEREEEKQQYDFHENSPDDQRYRAFLSRLSRPVNEMLRPNSQGLDFGCGPGPTLSVMLEELGHKVAIFDSFYEPHLQVFEASYDFITASEVVEHLHYPRREFDRLWSCLRPGGILGIMTKRVLDKDRFSSWHYKDDPTHVCFYRESTFEWLARCWDAELQIVSADVVIIRKNPSS
jgi:SAM-dependent methyltransferase